MRSPAAARKMGKDATEVITKLADEFPRENGPQSAEPRGMLTWCTVPQIPLTGIDQGRPHFLLFLRNLFAGQHTSVTQKLEPARDDEEEGSCGASGIRAADVPHPRRRRGLSRRGEAKERRASLEFGPAPDARRFASASPCQESFA